MAQVVERALARDGAAQRAGGGGGGGSSRHHEDEDDEDDDENEKEEERWRRRLREEASDDDFGGGAAADDGCAVLVQVMTLPLLLFCAVLQAWAATAAVLCVLCALRRWQGAGRNAGYGGEEGEGDEAWADRMWAEMQARRRAQARASARASSAAWVASPSRPSSLLALPRCNPQGVTLLWRPRVPIAARPQGRLRPRLPSNVPPR